MSRPALQPPPEHIGPLTATAGLAARDGARVYLAGGTLRDLLIGLSPPDVDLAVDGDAMALGRRAAAALGGRFVPLKAELDSCRVVLPGVQLDFTGLRGPDISADLVARDFSVNALALPLEDYLAGGGDVLDPAGGLKDLAARLLRPAGPGVLAADPLRVLRAFRFMSSHGLALAPGCAERLAARAPLLARVPGERVGHEWLALMAGSGVGPAVRAMERSGALDALVPELAAGRGLAQNPYHHLDVLGHSLACLQALAEIAADPAPWLSGRAGEVSAYLAAPERRALLFTAALLHDLGKVPARRERGPGWATFYRHEVLGRDLAREVCRRLGLSKARAGRVAGLVGGHMRPFHLMGAGGREGITARAVRRLLEAAGDDLPGLMALAMADTMAGRGPERPPEAEARLLDLYRQVSELRDQSIAAALAAPPLVNGRELMEHLGIGPGPEVGRLLNLLREAQLEGEVDDKAGALALAVRLRAGA